MDDLTILKDIAIPLASGFLAYLGARRGKNASYREALFLKHLEASAELIPLLYDVRFCTRREEMFQKYQAFQAAWHKWQSCLPSSVDEKIATFSSAATDKTFYYLAQDYSESNLEGEEKQKFDEAHLSTHRLESISTEVDAALKQVLAAFRKILGVEPLSQETLKSFDPEALEKITVLKSRVKIQR